MTKGKINLDQKTILVTGSPGFIGTFLVLRLLKDMKAGLVISLDNMNDYYDPKLKEYRLKMIENASEHSDVKHIFIRGSIADRELVRHVFSEYRPSVIVNLAAQAGVRYSIENPDAYMESNIIGFYNILEACRKYPVEHLVFASSSSVYGENTKIPFSTDDLTDHPVSLYAATKKSNELLAYTYSKLYGIPTTGLRLFSVYGPAGRPDMFYYTAAEKYSAGEKIILYNNGNCKRDFTYIDDVIESIQRVIKGPPEKDTVQNGLSEAPYAVYNIGKGFPDNVLDFITTLQEELVKAKVLPDDYDFENYRELAPAQPGDVPLTFADTKELEKDYKYKPKTDIRQGLRAFAEWYRKYHY